MMAEHEDGELQRLWDLVNELSQQLSANRAQTAKLQAQVGQLKDHAEHTGSGSRLRRFNLDISKETFETELERTNAHVILEHQHLTQENKQLSALLKEFEQTLDNVMAKFRGHAIAAHQHEQTLVRHYQTLLAARNSGDATSGDSFAPQPLALNPQHLEQLTHHLRLALRSFSGSPDPAGELSAFDSDSEQPGDDADEHAPSEWAVEREAEIARLEAENAELRKALGIDGPLRDDEAREFGMGMGLSISSMDTVLKGSPQHHPFGSNGSGFMPSGPGGPGGPPPGPGGGPSSMQSAWRPQQPQLQQFPQQQPQPQQMFQQLPPPLPQKPAMMQGRPNGPPAAGRGIGAGLAPAPQIGSTPVVRSQPAWGGGRMGGAEPVPFM
ncbi:hypothetical protein BKA62DRAFT_650353 [Auriculariales sp. MPI-PUGE-AT-0066]|nr:hypothetical protein BKA62DRAFT_650353 [Auriculariales sp. MPI-PUGE-AT-0066]